MGGYWTRVEWLAVSSRWAKLATSHRFMTCGRVYRYDTLLEGLAQDLQHVAPELGPFVQEEPAVVRPRHLARQGEVSAADPPHSRDRLMQGCDTGRS